MVRLPAIVLASAVAVLGLALPASAATYDAQPYGWGRSPGHRPDPSPRYRTPPPAVIIIGPPVVRNYNPPRYVPSPRTVTPRVSCRVFQGDATIDASGRPFYGTACLESDGRWHIID